MADLRALKDKADQCLGRRQYRQAEKVYAELIRHDPNDARLHVRMGELARRLGEPQRAAQSYYRAAQLFAREGQGTKARGACLIARELDPATPALPMISDIANREERKRAIEFEDAAARAVRAG